MRRFTKIDFEERRKFVGASDVPAIMGVSPFAGPLDVYLAKIGADRSSVPYHVSAGNYIEQASVAWFEDIFRKNHSGQPAGLRQLRAIHGDGLLAAHVDWADANPPSIIAECKTVGITHRDAWGEAETDEIPIWVDVQVQAQLMATGAGKAYVIAAMPDLHTVHFVAYHVQPNERLQEAILQSINDFWRQHVVANVPPPAGTGDIAQSLDALRRLPRGVEVCHLPEDLLLLRLAAVRELRLAAEKCEEAAEAALLAEMGEAASMATTPSGWSFALSEYQRSDIDRNKMREDGVYDAYLKKTTVRRATIKPPTKGASAIAALGEPALLRMLPIHTT